MSSSSINPPAIKPLTQSRSTSMTEVAGEKVSELCESLCRIERWTLRGLGPAVADWCGAYTQVRLAIRRRELEADSVYPAFQV